MKHFIIWLVCIISAPTLSAQQMCIDLFALQSSHDIALAQTVDIIRSLETDRYIAYSNHAGKDVYTYLRWLQKTQQKQISRLTQIDYSHVPQYIVAHYRDLLIERVENFEQNIQQLKSEFNLRQIPIEELIHPTSKKWEYLASEVLRLTIQTNPLLAEFLAAVRFPNVIHTEMTIQNITKVDGGTHPQISNRLEKVGQKEIDLISRDGQEIVWVEVKYLGRHKLYDDATGNDVINKMINAQKVADLMPDKTRVILMIVGPGRLKPEALKLYTDAKIQVIYQTPKWE